MLIQLERGVCLQPWCRCLHRQYLKHGPILGISCGSLTPNWRCCPGFHSTLQERSQPALGCSCPPGPYQMAEGVAATLKMPKSLSISNPLPLAEPGKEMRDLPGWKFLEQPVQRQTYSARSWTGAKKNSSTFSSLSQLEHCIPIFVVVYYSLLLIQGLLKINIC